MDFWHGKHSIAHLVSFPPQMYISSFTAVLFPRYKLALFYSLVSIHMKIAFQYQIATYECKIKISTCEKNRAKKKKDS